MNEGRELIRHVDGTAIFRSPLDQEQEAKIANFLARKWNVNIVPFPMLHVLDFYAERYNRPVGMVECKWRNHASHERQNVILSVRKWDALYRAQWAHGCPGVFAVRFDDGVFVIRLNDIDPHRVRIAGGKGALSEPCIDVPIASMWQLNKRRVSVLPVPV